jgi:hypothetical protein
LLSPNAERAEDARGHKDDARFSSIADSAVFCKQPARKLLRIKQFASKFPTQASRESIRPSRELIRHFEPEQGIRREIDPHAAARPISSKVEQ